MMLVALLGGIALTNAKLGAVHGFAGVLGGMYAAPHGAICAALLPGATEVNLRALRARQPDNPALARYAEAAQALTRDPRAEAEALVPWLRALVAELGIRPLGAYGLKPADYPAIVEKSARASSMKGNPITLTPDELTAILAGATA
jgi:alcohol dehydrogenase class IV